MGFVFKVIDLDFGHDSHAEVEPFVDVQQDSHRQELSVQVGQDLPHTSIVVIALLIDKYDDLFKEEYGHTEGGKLQVEEHERNDFVSVPYALDHLYRDVEEHSSCDDAHCSNDDIGPDSEPVIVWKVRVVRVQGQNGIK